MTVKKEVRNILILDTGKEWGGGTNSLLELLKRVNRDKYRISVLFYTNCTYGRDSDIKTEIEKLGFKFLILPQQKQSIIVKILKELSRTIFFFSKAIKKQCVFFIEYQSRIKRNAKLISDILRNQRVDLFYLNNQPSSNLEGILASEIAGTPALLHARIESNLNFVEVKASNRSLSKIICVSDGVRNVLVNQGIDSSKCVVVHNGISSETKPSIPSQEIKARWGISDNDILIGSVGSIIKRKRFNDLITAVNLIKTKTECRFKCLIVGEGSELENLRKMVKKNNLDDIVLFAGFQIDAISYINAMDLFVLTSEKEGLPRVILEAMLMGKPVVSSRTGGALELIDENKTGLMFQTYNTNELADCMLRLLSSSRLRTDMGAAGRARVIKNYSINKYADNVQKVFNEILEINNVE